MSRFIVSSSPHITSSNSTRKIMLDVIIALIPAIIASILIYGFYPLFLIILCVASCVFSEWAFNAITKKPQTVGDLSAIVTGIILALNLPPVVPFYVPMVGGAFAIIIVKMLFGGIGKNFANPAITARIFLMLAWTTLMTKFVVPIDLSNGLNMFEYFKHAVDLDLPNTITSATPLVMIKDAIANGTNPAEGLNALDMFLGRIGGSAGEVSTLAILIGFVYLVARRVIDVKIPVIYLLSTVIFTALFFCTSPYCGEYVWTYLLSGGVVFGAVFMATDYSTSPNSTIAVVLYSIGLGLLTVVFRKYTSMPGGVSFSILIMNILTPLLERIRPKAFGTPKKKLAEVVNLHKFKKSNKVQEGGAK